jgi:hypothetical protein
MLRKGFDQPVINLHELTNGLEKYWNPTLKQEVLGKPQGTEWGYYQTLSEIEDMLGSVDHYVTSRLAHYHIVNRQDSIAEQMKFYQYLNQNFYIISCRRKNILEHVLSWAIHAHSKVLNVYSPQEKINSFHNIYKNKITVNEESLVTYLNKYKNYLEWVDRHFHVQRYFNYEDSINDLEEYILSLDFMQGNQKNSWQDMFGQDFNQWNSCHRILPNLVLHEQQGDNPFTLYDNTARLKWDQLKGSDWPKFESASDIDNLPATIQKEIKSHFDVSTLNQTFNLNSSMYNFLTEQLPRYNSATDQISTLVKQGFLVTGVPIKLQTFKEKQMIVNNFDQCVEWYNKWANINDYDLALDVDNQAATEELTLSAQLITRLTKSVAVNKS